MGHQQSFSGQALANALPREVYLSLWPLLRNTEGQWDSVARPACEAGALPAELRSLLGF